MPLGDFGANIEGAGGFAGHFAVGLGDSLVSLGGEGAWLWYGDESRKVPLSPTIPDIIVTVNTDNAMALFHGRMRVQARQARWRPYADGLVGFNYIYTRTSIEDSGACDLYACGSGLASTNLDDFVLSVGGGAGMMYDFGAPGGAKLDLSVRYLWGGEARYLTEGAIRRQGDQVSFDVSRSRTDMLVVYVGVAFGR